MGTVLATWVFLFTFYLLIQFARQEHVQEEYDDAIMDVERGLVWARSRASFPFGMKAQLEMSCELLVKAKSLWKENKWQQAYIGLLSDPRRL